MTQQDDITQRVLTDAEIQALWDEACKDSPRAPGWNRHIRFARALLSKVPAPVAGERATKALNRIERRASDDGRQRDIDDLAVVRAALASAPVAGEAQPVAVRTRPRHGDGSLLSYWTYDDFYAHAPVLTRIEDERGIREPLYAAPQASAENVRNAALEKAAVLVGGHTWAGASQIVSDLIAEHIRALKQPQADKDGGQQRAGDAERWRWATATDENAQMLYTIVQAYGGDQQKINERADFYRAALSATQAEQGERDAG